MPDTRYFYNVDLEHPTTSHSQAVLLVTPGSTVLDVGAADGSVARPLAARGCRVWAIELDAGAAAKARSSCERVIVGDIEHLDLGAVLEEQRFDFVLLLDVLEHLRDPLALLKRLRDRLSPGGRVIASIPNVTHGAVRLSLMSGAFTYTETGLLDRTHLRFFDRRGAENLFADARLRIVERLRVTRGLTETEIPIDVSQFSPSVLEKLNEDPDATTYQFLLVGKPSEGEHIPEGVSLAERLQRKADTLEVQYRALEVYARSLEQQQQRADEERAQAADVRSELERRMSELTQQHLELRYLQADLAVKEAFITELRQAKERAAVVKEAAVAQESERTVAERRVAAALRHELSVAQEDLARTREALERLQVFTNSPGFRIFAKVTRSLNNYPRTYRMLQGVVRGVAGKPRE